MPLSLTGKSALLGGFKYYLRVSVKKCGLILRDLNDLPLKGQALSNKRILIVGLSTRSR
jgi:hypothetical protein